MTTPTLYCEDLAKEAVIVLGGGSTSDETCVVDSRPTEDMDWYIYIHQSAKALERAEHVPANMTKASLLGWLREVYNRDRKFINSVHPSGLIPSGYDRTVESLEGSSWASIAYTPLLYAAEELLENNLSLLETVYVDDIKYHRTPCFDKIVPTTAFAYRKMWGSSDTKLTPGFGVSPFLGAGSLFPVELSTVDFRRVMLLCNTPATLVCSIVGDHDSAISTLGMGLLGIREFITSWYGVVPSERSIPIGTCIPFVYGLYQELPTPQGLHYPLGYLSGSFGGGEETNEVADSYSPAYLTPRAKLECEVGYKLVSLLWYIVLTDSHYLIEKSPGPSDELPAVHYYWFDVTTGKPPRQEAVPFRYPALVYLLASLPVGYLRRDTVVSGELGRPRSEVPESSKLKSVAELLSDDGLQRLVDAQTVVQSRGMYSTMFSELGACLRGFAVQLYALTSKDPGIFFPKSKVYPKRSDWAKHLHSVHCSYLKCRSLSDFTELFQRVLECSVWGVAASACKGRATMQYGLSGKGRRAKLALHLLSGATGVPTYELLCDERNIDSDIDLDCTHLEESELTRDLRFCIITDTDVLAKSLARRDIPQRINLRLKEGHIALKTVASRLEHILAGALEVELQERYYTLLNRLHLEKSLDSLKGYRRHQGPQMSIADSEFRSILATMRLFFRGDCYPDSEKKALGFSPNGKPRGGAGTGWLSVETIVDLYSTTTSEYKGTYAQVLEMVKKVLGSYRTGEFTSCSGRYHERGVWRVGILALENYLTRILKQ
jgi:hypothetical protein